MSLLNKITIISTIDSIGPDLLFIEAYILGKSCL